MKTMFVQQIEEAMRPLVGIVDVTIIHQHGLNAAYEAYDRLKDYPGSGVPTHLSRPQACAEALAEAVKSLGISYQHLRNVVQEQQMRRREA
jgi:hypothetical protein